MDECESVYVQAVEQLLDLPLRERGFTLARKEHTARYCSQAYVRSEAEGEDLYVIVSVSVDPRDQPWSVLASIGQGSLDGPEADWNGLPLWKLARAHDQEYSPAYRFDSKSTLAAAMQNAARDLLSHGHAFLEGDVTEFLELRAKLNASRTPYQVHKRGAETGQHPTKDDAESAELKRRFSDG